MIFLQIILVPLIALALIISVFMIGVSATISPRNDSPDDQLYF